MTDLLQRLKHSHRAEPERVKPRFSRKTKCVTVTVFIDAIPMEVSVSIKNLDTAIVRLTDLADGTGPLQMLLEGSLDARQEFGHIIDGKKKTRGRPSRSKEISFKLQYASAWTYCFIRHQWERPIKNRNPFLKKAESRLRRRLRREERVDSWKNTTRSWQIRLLTAFLVGNVYANEQKRHGLKDPLANFAKFHDDSFYRTYIQPRLKHVESLVRKRPTLLDSLSNAFLRKVFDPLNF